MLNWNESAWTALAAGAALKSMLVLAAAWLAAKCLRGSSAATRHLVWSVALAAIVAVPLLALALPAWHLPFATPSIAFNVTTSASPDSPIASPEASRMPVHALASPASRVPRQPHWALYLLLLWGAGAAIMLARTLAATLWLSRLKPAPGWQASADEAARATGLAKPVRVRQSAPGTMPMAFGSSVCLPEDAANWTEERRRMVLLHEMAHLRRGDTAWHAVARFALSLYWWNPLAWAAWRESLKEAETAADDLVLTSGARASDYAALLLDVAREFTTVSAGAPAALAMARRSQLEGRLVAILDARANRQPHTRVAAAVAILAAASILPLASVRAQDPTPTAQAPADIDATIRAAIEQKNHELLDEAAKAAEAQRHYDAAQKLLDSSLQIRQQHAGNNSPEYAEGLIRLGQLAGQRDQLPQAASYYTQAAAILGEVPAAARPLMSLGVTQLLLKKYDEAFATFQHAQQLDPSHAAMATAWSAVVRSQQDVDSSQAETLYRQALSLAAPGSTDAAVISRMLAGFLTRQGRTAEADELTASANSTLSIRVSRDAHPPTGNVYKVGGGVSAPQLIYKVEPEYTEEARAAKLSGAVMLSIEVGPDGVAHNIEVTEGLGLGLDQNAVAAVSQWKFKPAVADGQPVTVAAKVQVNFKLL